MNEPRMEETHDEMQQKAEQMRQMAVEMQDKVTDGINKAMSTTAESLEKTADTIHKTAEFFKDKNADTLKQDISGMVKKYPGQSLVGALIFGFIFGRIISR